MASPSPTYLSRSVLMQCRYELLGGSPAFWVLLITSLRSNDIRLVLLHIAVGIFGPSDMAVSLAALWGETDQRCVQLTELVMRTLSPNSGAPGKQRKGNNCCKFHRPSPLLL